MKLQTSKLPLGLLLAGVLLSASVQSVCAATLLSDNFDTVNSTIWTTTNTSGSGNATANGTLFLNVNSTGNSQRTTLISKSSDFNPFVTATQSITATFTGLTISGTPSVGTTATNGGGNYFYSYIGNPTGGTGTGNSYNPGSAGNFLAFGIVQRLNLSSQPFTQFQFDDRSTAAGTNISAAVSLSGTPTAFTWTVNGTSGTYSITLTGATFSAALANTSLSNGNLTLSGNLTRFTSANFGSNSTSYLAIGAMNLTANVTAATTAGLDSILVTAIPEPTATALLIAAGSIAFLIMRKRRRS